MIPKFCKFSMEFPEGNDAFLVEVNELGLNPSLKWTSV